MTKRNCFSCGTVFEDHISIWKCATCQQTEKMSKMYKEQNKLIEEQNRIARQQAAQQAAQIYYAASPPPVYYHSPEPKPQPQPQMKRWDTPPAIIPEKKYSILDKIISHFLVLINWTFVIFVFLSPPILAILSGWIIWMLTGKLLWLLAVIPLWFILLIPICKMFGILHYKWQLAAYYYLTEVPDKHDFPMAPPLLFYDTW